MREPVPFRLLDDGDLCTNLSQHVVHTGSTCRRMEPQIKQCKLDLAQLFDEDMLVDDLDAWLIESSLMKRTFRTCAIIAGLINLLVIGYIVGYWFLK